MDILSKAKEQRKETIMGVSENVKVAYVFYEERTETGEIIDSNFNDSEPFAFQLERRKVYSGFESAVCSMAIGETREFIIPPQDAYGVYNPHAVQNTIISELQCSEDLEVGKRVTIRGQNSIVPLPGLVKDISGNVIQIDFNHPLAGKSVFATITLVDLREIVLPQTFSSGIFS